jgi:hypothetical protein
MKETIGEARLSSPPGLRPSPPEASRLRAAGRMLAPVEALKALWRGGRALLVLVIPHYSFGISLRR